MTTDSDYVYFDRSTSTFSSDAVARATAAKMKLEAYYKNALETTIELNVQYVSVPPPLPLPTRRSHTSTPAATCIYSFIFSCFVLR